MSIPITPAKVWLSYKNTCHRGIRDNNAIFHNTQLCITEWAEVLKTGIVMVVANPNPWNGKLHQKAFGVIFADSQSLKITQKISQHWRDAKLNVFEFLRLYFVLICQSSVIQQLTIFFLPKLALFL